MRPPTVRRWPVAPLLETRTRAELERVTGAAWRTVRRACEEGLTDEQAYAWADACGLHAWLVWPELADEAEAAAKRECASDGCGVLFIPCDRNPHQKFCSGTCSARERMRRYRATERGREANRRYAAQYKAYLRERRTA